MTTSVLDLDAVRDQFTPDPGFFNTASLGAPPRATVDAVRAAIDAWSRGRATAGDFDVSVVGAREAFARLAGVPASSVAAGATVSPLVGLIAAAVPDGAEVLVADDDFTSLLFPFAAQAGRGVTLRSVPLASLPGEVRESTALVAVSAVQSADGALVDVAALRNAASATGAQVLLDTTQATGWLPLDLSWVDYAVCGAYKWLLSPRGSSFLVVRPDRLDSLVPHAANWYAGADIWASIYGLPLRLASDARRFDTSPAWFSWVGTATSLELLADLDAAAVHAHDVALANRLRAGLGLAPGESAIVSAPVDAVGQERLRAASIRTAVRAGAVRFSCHLYTTEADVDLALNALAG
ncbi:aminotransferase class V-fold PLP-dependent enzyme [Cryptosporangium aurantiacum]|uniref:aminotransferase class V-fold PLP-dependent enzyme n=1 Tax=Cryptosporangium aurantiacum TaxID=134849 RepID=UPI00093369FC|nr:aminotransferase class V-fold PLP-dependent enzyme [Cryptosporangium aurantiacum]